MSEPTPNADEAAVLANKEEIKAGLNTLLEKVETMSGDLVEDVLNGVKELLHKIG